jgi:hypothetical protein
LFDGDLARESFAGPSLSFIDEGGFGGEDASAAFFDDDATLSTSSASAASGRDEEVVLSKGTEKFSAHGNGNGTLVVDEDIDLSRRDES